MFRWQSFVFGGFTMTVIMLIGSLFMGAGFTATIMVMLLAFFGGTLIFVAAGLRKIPVGYKALKLWLGARQVDEALSEGWVWWWPKPLGELLVVDCRVKNLDIPLKEVLTKDKVAVEMKVSLSYHVGPGKRDDGRPLTMEDWAHALNHYTNVGEEDFQKQLQEEAAEKFRAASSTVPSESIHESQNDILQGAGSSKGVKEALQDRTKEFGANIKEVQIANITLPPEIVAAAAQQKAEEGQKKAEETEREGVQSAIKGYRDLGLTPAEALRAHQTERGKVKETVQTVNVPGLTEVAGVIGAAISSAMKKD